MSLQELSKSEGKGSKKLSRKKNDLIDFVAEQFKQLSKKNIRVPIKLYHL